MMSLVRYWPVVFEDGRAAVVSNGFRNPEHLGVDIMGRRLPHDPPYRDGDPRGTPGFFCPGQPLIRAVGPGKVRYSKDSFNGWRVEVDHSDAPTRCFYAHMIPGSALVKEGEIVMAGQPLGIMGGDPSPADRRHTVHLHLGGYNLATGKWFDLEPFMQGWLRTSPS
jgi:murein DD-endopeptidase MepM/ murein hydrolase activator NlpD